MGSSNGHHADGAQAELVGEARTVALSKIAPNKWNYNKQDEKTFNKLVESLRRFGFVSPVIVRQNPKKKGTYEVINGEHRFHAAKVLGLKDIPVVDLGKLDDSKAKQLSIILNELSGSPDQVRLAELLRDISDDVSMGDLQVVMPYTERELKMFVEAVDFSFDSLSGADPRSQDEQTAQVEGSRDALNKAAAATAAAAQPSSEAEAEAAVAGMTFSLSPDDTARVAQALKAIDDDPNVALVSLIDQYLDSQEPSE